MQKARVANILIVEDEPPIQELLAFNIKQSGHRAIQDHILIQIRYE